MTRSVRLSVASATVLVAIVLFAQPALAAASADVLGADRLGRGQTLEVTASATCDPLAGDSFASLSVTVFQGSYLHPNYREGQGGVGLEGVNGLICDGTAHTYTFVVRLTSFFEDKKFTPGPAGAEWSVQVCTRIDPENTVCTGAAGPTQDQIRITP